MKLIEIENKIKSLIAEDINNPDIFTQIQKLSYYWLKRRKIMSWDNEAEDVSYIIAEELYMKILRGEPIYSWIGYISRSYMGFIRKYKKLTGSEIISAKDDAELKSSVVEMSAGGSMNSSNGYMYGEINDLTYINDVPSLIDGIMEKYSRYYKYTSSYYNQYVSIMLSLINNEPVPFKTDKSEEMYLGVILAKVKYELSKNMKFLADKGDNTEFSLLQMFAMEGADTEDESYD
jgi:hypothetical protein